ncbi:MAG: electron transport complex subunit RsxG [Gammaproteobacteria bacterium]|nr:electron transport complex subunit RsxG [Gammaproteobacteria bacterium]
MSAARRVGRAAALLAVFAVLGTGLVAITYETTIDRIRANERAVLERRITEIVPPSRYTNDPLTDTIRLRAPEAFGTDEAVTVYRACRDAEPVAAVATVIATNGYNGAIRLLVGVYHDGTLAGVRVLGHQETPGLGDAIEASKSDWLAQFNGKELGHPPQGEWRVARDGGAFDQLTGATITPRAVVQAIRRFLIYFGTHRERLFAPARSETS